MGLTSPIDEDPRAAKGRKASPDLEGPPDLKAQTDPPGREVKRERVVKRGPRATKALQSTMRPQKHS